MNETPAGKGQDERALNKRQRAELQALRDNQQRLITFDGGAELLPWVTAHKHHADEPYIGCLFCREEFVPRAALVESEARERELRERFAAFERQTFDVCDRRDAREAVLVEALREAETALDEINVQAHSTASRWIRNRSFDALAKLRSALAGVVEAEPDRRRGERRWHQVIDESRPERRSGVDRRRAEPDGGTDDR